MSAGICGKRLGIEEIFGSSSSPSSAKRSRCSHAGSPVRSFDLGFGPEEKISALLCMFPSMDREVVETVLNSHGQKIDDAIKSLHSLCLNTPLRVDHTVEGPVTIESSSRSEEYEHAVNRPLNMDGSSWVDIFVQEMMKASDWDDVRDRVTKVLVAFESDIVNHLKAPHQAETESLREQLECLLRDNQILKKAVGIQHDRNLELEEKSKEVDHLRHLISQNQEQVRNLEMSNYTLKIHLQRAQEARSIPNHFNPDIF